MYRNIGIQVLALLFYHGSVGSVSLLLLPLSWSKGFSFLSMRWRFLTFFPAEPYTSLIKVNGMDV